VVVGRAAGGGGTTDVEWSAGVWVQHCLKQLQDSFGGGCLQRTPKVVCCALLCALQEAKQADKAAKQEAARRRRAMRWVFGGCIRVASG
jgi:hypothetical protein